jgi:uncharacterized protein (TIGR03437 family)
LSQQPPDFGGFRADGTRERTQSWNRTVSLVVQFDGRPATPIALSPDRALFQPPNTDATTLNVNGKAVRPSVAAPGVFATDGKGQAAAVNEDGTLNSEANPAPRGSPLAIYLTGAGRLGSAESIEVRVGSAAAEVLFAGPAPGLPGVYQVNIKLPGVFTPPGVRALGVSLAGASSQGEVTVAVQ